MTLDVWLYGRRLATLAEPKPYQYRWSSPRRRWTSSASGGPPVLVPADGEQARLKRGRSEHFWTGSCQKGRFANEVARRVGVPTYDIMGLLEQVGRECAGAIQLLPPGMTPDVGHLEPLSDSEVTELIAELPVRDWEDALAQHASLAGLQDKILLTKTAEGWAWPVDGAASTHIVKPQPLGSPLDTLVLSEHWAMSVACSAGIKVAETRIQTFAGREAIVVTRYDREGGQRIHQEDFCQALGLAPDDKYETDRKGPSRFSQIAHVARRGVSDPNDFRIALLRAVTFNVVIGSGDSHSKNYSLLISRTGEVSLAPLYDVAPTLHLNENYKNSGQLIGSRIRLDRITGADLVEEARSWGMTVDDATEVVSETVQAIVEEIGEAPVPPRLEKVVASLLRFVELRCVPGVLLP